MNRLSDTHKTLVREHINEIVHFLETGEELTDHLITAIEERELLGDDPSDNEVYGAINIVIESDFGGFYTVLMDEQERSKVYFNNYRKALWKRLLTWFRMPYVWFVIMLFFVAMYYSYTYLPEQQIRISIWIILGLVPTVSIMLYYLFTLRNKPSFKRQGIMSFSIMPMLANLLTFQLENLLPFEQSFFTGYTYSFIYAGVLITISCMVALTAVAMIKEELLILKYRTD